MNSYVVTNSNVRNVIIPTPIIRKIGIKIKSKALGLVKSLGFDGKL